MSKQQEQRLKHQLSLWIRVRTGFFVLLATLWHLIFRIWTILIIGVVVGILGNAAFTFLTAGQISLRGTLTVFIWLGNHLILFIIILTLLLLVTLCSYLAHHSRRRVFQGNRPVLEESTTHEIPLTNLGNIPYRRNPFFTGRERLLQELHKHLLRGITTAITGLGGIGKTEIAIEYIYRYRQEYRSVFWVRAESSDTLISDFVTISGLLELPEYGTRDLNIAVNAVKRWLENNTNWLLVIDNANDLTRVNNFLPSQIKGHILLTTRSQAMSGIAHALEIHNMEPAEGALLLLRRAGLLNLDATLEDVSATNQNAAIRISQSMGGLPLALDQAGAYIEETACSLIEYLNLYERKYSDLLKRRGGIANDHPEPVATTWSISFEKIEQTNSTAADLLRFCAFLHHESIPVEIFTEGALKLGLIEYSDATNKLELNNAIGELRKFSFIQRNADINTLSIHPLVQLILKERIDYEKRHLWAERIVRAINHLLITVPLTTWQEFQRFIQQIQRCADLIKEYELFFSEGTQFLDLAGRIMQKHASYTQSEELFLQELTICEATVGSDHPDTANTLNNLAWLYYKQGKYDQAEPLCLRALIIRRAMLGQEHIDTVESLNYLARLYHRQGKYDQAKPLYLEALTISKKVLKEDHLSITNILNNLARLYSDQGKYFEAEPLYLQALKIRETRLGPTHPDTLDILSNLAILYRTQKKYDRSEELNLRTLAIREATLGPTHPATAKTLNNLARLYRTLGKYDQAESNYLKALAIRKATLRPTHPDIASTLNNLAWLYFIKGKYSHAEQLYLQALNIREKSLGEAHPDTATTLNDLALCYTKQGKYNQAEPLYKRALAIREARLSSTHPDLATVLENYAELLHKTKLINIAKQLDARAQSIRAQKANLVETDSEEE